MNLTARHSRFGFFLRRLAALLLDIILISTLLLPLLFLLYGPEYFSWRSTHGWNLIDPLTVYRADEFLLTSVLPAVLLVLSWHRWGATPGKFLLGLRVVDVRSGKPPGLAQAFLRLVGYLISAPIFYLGFLWSLWNRNQCGWHDLLAHTRVVYEIGYEDVSLDLLSRESQ